MGSKKKVLQDLGATRSDLHFLDPRKINVIWDENPRKDYGNDEEMDYLIDSISNNGVQVPLKIYIKNDETYLAHGFRRMRATLQAIENGVNIEKIPVQTVPNNIESILVDHFTLNSGKALSQIEKAEALHHLSKVSGLNQAGLIKRTGLKQSTVSVLMNFSDNASTKLKEAVLNGEISFMNSIDLIRNTEGISEQNNALEEALNLNNTNKNEQPKNNKKKKVSKTAIKIATNSKKLTPFERLVQLGDALEDTDFGKKLNIAIRLVREKQPIEEILEDFKE